MKRSRAFTSLVSMRCSLTLSLALACACGGSDSGTASPSVTAGQPALTAGTTSTPNVAAGSAGNGAAGTRATQAGTAAVSGGRSADTTTPSLGGSSGAQTPAPAAGTLAAGSGGSPSAAAGSSGSGEAPPSACDPADETPAAELVPLTSITGSSNNAPIAPAKGPLPPIIEHDAGLATHTVYRPMNFGDTRYPVIVWANGGCVKNGTMFARFLLEIASHGFVIVADGKPNGSGMGPLETNGVPQTQALDWIVAENERPCSKFYRKLDTTKIAAMGQSCGGLMTLGVSGDKRLSTVVIWNSGMFERDQKIYMGLHTPMAYFIGGPDDVAHAQAEEDFAAIDSVPLFYGNFPIGHSGTYAQDNGGEFARVGIGWLKWQLYGDMTEAGGKMFLGADCGLCKGTMWTVQKKMMD